jgi:hypothetical protein
MERQVMKIFGLAIIGTVLVVTSAPIAGAHHSAAAMDFNNTVELEGVVQRLEVVNPHLTLVLQVTDEKGTRDIEFEGHSRNNVYRSGWRPDLIEFGNKIKITIAPMRDGSEGGYVTAFETESGERVGR